MKSRFSPDQIRYLWRPEVLLTLVLLAALIGWIYIDRKSTDAEAELLAATNSLTTAESDLGYWTNNFDQATLLETLMMLQAIPKAPGLPTQQESLDFRNEFMAYTSKNLLPLNSLEVLTATIQAGDTTLPAVRYSMVVSGNLDSLVGALQIFDSFPTATVHTMEFTREETDIDSWNLGITLDVVHQPEEA